MWTRRDVYPEETYGGREVNQGFMAILRERLLWNSQFELFFVSAYCAEHYAGKLLSYCVLTHVLFASPQLGRVTTTGILLGPATCLPHKDGGILSNALPQDTTSTLSSI